MFSLTIASKAFKTWSELYEDTQAVPITAETNSVARRLVLEGERDEGSDVVEGLFDYLCTHHLWDFFLLEKLM